MFLDGYDSVRQEHVGPRPQPDPGSPASDTPKAGLRSVVDGRWKDSSISSATEPLKPDYLLDVNTAPVSNHRQGEPLLRLLYMNRRQPTPSLLGTEHPRW